MPQSVIVTGTGTRTTATTGELLARHVTDAQQICIKIEDAFGHSD